jgi:pimeloyl-ACP methyl ester carboxylesterase
MRFTHDVSIEYSVDLPTAKGGPLLFLHGLSGILSTYDEVVASLADLGRPIYRLDLRGHGRSERAPGTYSVPFYAADVVAFIESVIGKPVVLVGHSLGGVITHHLAATRPDLIVGALTEDPPLYFCDQSLFDRSMFSQVFPILESQMREIQASGASFEDVARSSPTARLRGVRLLQRCSLRQSTPAPSRSCWATQTCGARRLMGERSAGTTQMHQLHARLPFFNPTQLWGQRSGLNMRSSSSARTPMPIYG